MMSAPEARTSAGFIALTVAAVPTGMNAGVLISPRRIMMVPVRALPSVAAMENEKRLTPGGLGSELGPRNGRDRPEKAAGKEGGAGRAGCPDQPSDAAGGLLRATAKGSPQSITLWGAPSLAAHRGGGGDEAVLHRLRREHEAAGHVAGGEDVARRGAPFAVDGDEAARVGRDARRAQIQRLGVRRPADRRDRQRRLYAFAAMDHANAVIGGLERVDRSDPLPPRDP